MAETFVTFHVQHSPERAAKACVAFGKMGVDPDGLTFLKEEAS